MSTDPNRKSPRHIPTPEELAARNKRIVAAVRSGVTLTIVGQRFGGMSPKTVRAICAEQGYDVPYGRRG